MSERNVRRISQEPPIEGPERPPDASQVGRLSKTEGYREMAEKLLAEEPGLMSLEILRRLRLAGYRGGKSAVYELVAAMRPKNKDFVVRFEGVPGEFSQHDFGSVIVRFVDGTSRRVKFFASRLKYSRKVAVTLSENE